MDLFRQHNRSPRRGFFVALACMVMLSGCYSLNADVQIADDGSGTIAIDYRIPADAPAELFPNGAPCQSLASAANSLPSDAGTIELTEPDGGCGLTIRTDVAPGGQIPDGFVQAVESVQLENLGRYSGLSLRPEGDGWRFEAQFIKARLTDVAGSAELRNAVEQGTFELRVILPGRQAGHNADFIDDDGAMVWRIDPVLDRRTVLEAVSVPGETILGADPDVSPLSKGLHPAFWIALFVIPAVAVLGFSLYVLWQIRRDPAALVVHGRRRSGTPDEAVRSRRQAAAEARKARIAAEQVDAPLAPGAVYTALQVHHAPEKPKPGAEAPQRSKPWTNTGEPEALDPNETPIEPNFEPLAEEHVPAAAEEVVPVQGVTPAAPEVSPQPAEESMGWSLGADGPEPEPSDAATMYAAESPLVQSLAEPDSPLDPRWDDGHGAFVRFDLELHAWMKFDEAAQDWVVLPA